MDWFGKDAASYEFTMFQGGHIYAIVALGMSIAVLYRMKEPLKRQNVRPFELVVAFSLAASEVMYHIWLIRSDFWSVRDSLPLELCSISLLLTIVLLVTNSKRLYEIVFFTAMAGALQAIMTPVLSFDFPHFRYVHFFYTHIGMIVVVLYFTWVKEFRPTFRSVWKAMLFLNLLLPVILFVNRSVNGNYMFLTEKPPGGSLLDYLGPYPWYIVSLEFVACLMFVGLWAVFRENKHTRR